MCSRRQKPLLLSQPRPLFPGFRNFTSTNLQKSHPLPANVPLYKGNHREQSTPHHHSHHSERLLLPRPRSRPLAGTRSEVSNRLPSPPLRSLSLYHSVDPRGDLTRCRFFGGCLPLDLVLDFEFRWIACLFVPRIMHVFLLGLGSADLECVDVGIAPTCFCRSLIWWDVGHFTFAQCRFVGIKVGCGKVACPWQFLCEGYQIRTF
jgi:hypothetical protein